MKQDLAKNNFKPGSLRRPRTARTVLLRMAADDARAERIALLKDERPDLTWRRIADEVGVSERAAFEWKKTGGLEYENAKKLAGVFGVDVDYIWTGPRDETPNPFPVSGHLDGVANEFHRRVNHVEERLEQIETTILAQLAKQTRLLEDIRMIIGGETAFDALREFAETVVPEAPADGAVQPPARKPAAQRSRRAG